MKWIRAVEIIQRTGKKKISFLGLSCKAGTDELRNSPVVIVLETLLGKGYDIQIHDKNVNLSTLTGTNKAYIDRHIPRLSKLIVNRAAALIDDADVIVVNSLEKEYVDLLVKTASAATIIDMVRLPEQLRSRANYFEINW